MKKWTALEVQLGNLAAYLNSLEARGATIFSVTDGSGSRSGYMVVVSYTKE